ncbi:MAG: hypothetical protein L3J42_05225 [Hydrogenimonas sp.]|nr:hypothetical protein [Hydrogenimonas sp.]
MRAIAPLFLIIAFLIPLYSADKYAVVMNPNTKVKRLTKEQIRALYLDRRHFIGDTKVILLNLPFEHKIRDSFEKRILQKSKDELQREWMIAHFHGHRPPKVVESTDAMAKYILKVKGAIGYMSIEEAQKSGLKIVYVWEP